MTDATSTTQIDSIQRLYERFEKTTDLARSRLGRAVTLSEKILFAHLDNPNDQPYERGVSYAQFRPDRVAMQDATASAPPTPTATIAKPPAFGVCESVPIIIPPGNAYCSRTT